MEQKRSFSLKIVMIVAVILAIAFSGYALWQVNNFQKKWEDLDNAITNGQMRIDKMETHILNLEMTDFVNITSARLAFNLNRQFIFYGVVNQAPLTHDVIISLYTRDDFFKTENPDIREFIINLVKQHTNTVLQTVKFVSGITGTKVDNITISFVDNTDSKNILAQYKHKRLKVKINDAFVPIPLQK